MIIVLIGIAGSGKSTVGAALAEALGWQFYDGDEFHPEANREKIVSGTPLRDEDRWPWLEVLAELIREKENIVLACSALKQKYRDLLQVKVGVIMVHLKGDHQLIKGRLQARTGHFFREELFDSQVKDWEEPKACVEVDIDARVNQIVEKIRIQLKI